MLQFNDNQLRQIIFSDKFTVSFEKIGAKQLYRALNERSVMKIQ